MGRCGTRRMGCAGLSFCAVASFWLSSPRQLHAQSETADGVYGRLDGDIVLEPQLGATYSRNAALPELGVAAAYLSTIAMHLRYADSKLLLNSVEHNRQITSLDFELRPLFMARWSEAWETGPAWLDLTLDSWLLGMGVFWDHDRNERTLLRGAELLTGFGVPLLATNNGPWLRATAALRLAEGPRFTFETHAAYTLSLGWNLAINSGLHDDTD